MHNIFNNKLPIHIINKFEYKINYYNIRNKCTYRIHTYNKISNYIQLTYMVLNFGII